MTFRVLTTAQAEHDIRSYHDRIAFVNHQPLNAARWLDGIQAAVESLSWSPTRCPVAPRSALFDLEIRHHFHQSHRILFTVSGQQVVVLHVRWGGQQPALRDELANAMDELGEVMGDPSAEHRPADERDPHAEDPTRQARRSLATKSTAVLALAGGHLSG